MASKAQEDSDEKAHRPIRSASLSDCAIEKYEDHIKLQRIAIKEGRTQDLFDLFLAFFAFV